MRLIDADKLLKKQFRPMLHDGFRVDWYCVLSKAIKDADTVDAVPREEYERVCRERDAAVSDLVMCMHFSTKNNNVCNFCKKDMAEYPNKCAGWSDSCECNPEWRGVQDDT